MSKRHRRGDWTCEQSSEQANEVNALQFLHTNVRTYVRTYVHTLHTVAECGGADALLALKESTRERANVQIVKQKRVRARIQKLNATRAIQSAAAAAALVRESEREREKRAERRNVSLSVKCART